MDFRISGLIRFYDFTDVFVEVEVELGNEDPRYLEQMLYACLALRQFANIGDASRARHLEMYLRSVLSHPFDILRPERERIYKIAERPGLHPVIDFPTHLEMVDQVLSFKMPLAAARIGEDKFVYFGIASVMALYERLATQRPDDKTYLAQLAVEGGLCAHLFHNGRLTIENQLNGAYEIVEGVRSGRFSDGDPMLREFIGES